MVASVDDMMMMMMMMMMKQGNNNFKFRSQDEQCIKNRRRQKT